MLCEAEENSGTQVGPRHNMAQDGEKRSKGGQVVPERKDKRRTSGARKGGQEEDTGRQTDNRWCSQNGSLYGTQASITYTCAII